MLYLHLQNVQTEIRFVCKDLSKKKKGRPAIYIFFDIFETLSKRNSGWKTFTRDVERSFEVLERSSF